VRNSLKAIILCIALAGCNQNKVIIGNEETAQSASSVDIRITQEPNFDQDLLNEQMRVFISYLEGATGLRYEYVPAINYAHSYLLLVSGKVDLLFAGALGTSKVMSVNKKIEPIAIEEKSFLNVLLVNQKIFKEVEAELASNKPLQALKGRDVVFGSHNSGSTFLTPLLEMKSQDVYLNDLKSCIHEPKHEHRAMFLGDSDHHDFAFMEGTKSNPLMHVPDEARPKVFVGWISKVKRNHYVTASSNLLRPPKSVMVSKIQNALLTLNQPSDGHNKILQALGVTGFELPDGNINSESIEEMADFLAILGDNTHCSRKNAN